jgi:hypothetical protein
MEATYILGDNKDCTYEDRTLIFAYAEQMLLNEPGGKKIAFHLDDGKTCLMIRENVYVLAFVLNKTEADKAMAMCDAGKDDEFGRSLWEFSLAVLHLDFDGETLPEFWRQAGF